MSVQQANTAETEVSAVGIDRTGDVMIDFESHDIGDALCTGATGDTGGNPDGDFAVASAISAEETPVFNPEAEARAESKRNRLYFMSASVLLALTGLIVVMRKPQDKPRATVVAAAAKAETAKPSATHDSNNAEEVDGVSGVAVDPATDTSAADNKSTVAATDDKSATTPPAVTGDAQTKTASDTTNGGATLVPVSFENKDERRADVVQPVLVETKPDALARLTHVNEEELDSLEPDECGGKTATASKTAAKPVDSATSSVTTSSVTTASVKTDAKSLTNAAGSDTTEKRVAPAPVAKTGAKAAFKEAGEIEAKAGSDLAQLEQARWLYQRSLESGGLTGDDAKKCEERSEALASKVILSPKTPCNFPKAVFHTVEVGDSAERIARKYKVNIGQLKTVNKLNDKLVVKTGQNLKLLPGPVVYKVNRAELTGTLYIDGVLIRRFPVGIGPGNATPVGKYAVQNKVTNPDWYYDGQRVAFGDPVNILGTRWMGFLADDNAAGLGIHGTSLPESVPGRESKGCVRMHNADVEELFDLMPQGGVVEITD